MRATVACASAPSAIRHARAQEVRAQIPEVGIQGNPVQYRKQVELICEERLAVLERDDLTAMEVRVRDALPPDYVDECADRNACGIHPPIAFLSNELNRIIRWRRRLTGGISSS